MKLFSLIIATSWLTASAFGVAPLQSGLSKRNNVQDKPVVFAKNGAFQKPVFRDASVTRGGAVPGWKAYNDALDNTPIRAKALTSFVGFLLGDLLTQLFITKGALNWTRLARLSIFGLIYHGPSGHYFYGWLDKQIEGTGAKDVFSKVAIDQIFWCPIFMTVFFSYLGLTSGDSFSTIGNKIKTDLLSACQGSWKVWPFVHAVNFRFISTKHRLLFLNSVQIAFNMFLSIIGTK